MAEVTATVTAAASSASIIGTFPTDYTNARECTAITSDVVVLMDSASSCLPEDFATAATAYYSPAWECPDGYSAQSSCTRSASDDATRYTLTCCPSRSNVVMSCVPDPESLSSVWVDLLCTWSAGDTATVLLVTSTSVLTDGSTTSLTSAVTMSGGEGINAYGIRMIYDQSDTATSTTAETSETSVSSSSSSQSATQTESSDDNDDDDDDSGGGLSTGAIAAIAVVIPLVAIAALIGAWFWYRRRKQQKQPVSELGTDSERKELPPDTARGELYGSQRFQSHELENSTAPVELPGDDAPTSSPGLSTTGYTKDATSPSLSVAGVSQATEASPQFSVSAVNAEDER
ncbi:hypothetical protein B0T10DRAFT_608547 [Thelonectria olida]|uniref:Uncharacterized protein n=1 Tax=Thelonectria olida TaxID=1576542 RepID=A0A9P8W2F5_9HYPO|nr:hypothetical protein B0T10DRAFT_608547 [Thelonectria olida]